MIYLKGNHFGKRTAWSLLYFLIYAYLKISAYRKFLLSLSSIKFVITENINLTRFETWLTQNLVNFFSEPKSCVNQEVGVHIVKYLKYFFCFSSTL